MILCLASEATTRLTTPAGASQVNMPLLRLLHQFSSMYENVQETRLELRCRRPRADSVAVRRHASQESLAAGAGRAPEVEDTPRCWKTMCFLLDLYESMPPSKALADRWAAASCLSIVHWVGEYRRNGCVGREAVSCFVASLVALQS